MTVFETTHPPRTIPPRPLSAEAWGFRLGAGAAVVGSLLAMVGNLLHPVTPVGQPLGVAQAIAGSAGWVPIHLLIVAGLLLMFAGLVTALRLVLAEETINFAIALLFNILFAGVSYTHLIKTLTIIFPTVITLWTVGMGVLL